MLIRFFQICLIGIFLAGCQTGAMQEGQLFLNSLKSNDAKAYQVQEQSKNELPEYFKLLDEIGISAESAPTIEQKMNADYLTEEEGDIILQGLKARHATRAELGDLLVSSFPIQYQGKVRMINQQMRESSDVMYMDLLAKNITKGEAAQISYRNQTAFQKDINDVIAEYDRDLTSRHNQQVQASNQAMIELGQNLQEQQLRQQEIYNQNRPWYMNCQTYGNMTNCTGN